MKPNDQRNEFIRLRAEGKSYTAIGKELNISKATRETMVITNMLKAYETVELKAKLETIEGIIGGRE